MPWTGTPETGPDLGRFADLVGGPAVVVTAFLLTLAAAVAALGLGGTAQELSSRAVAVVIPGVALTLLIAPAALHAPWPVQPTAALIVATVAGLGLALTEPPLPQPEDGRFNPGRTVVFEEVGLLDVVLSNSAHGLAARAAACALFSTGEPTDNQVEKARTRLDALAGKGLITARENPRTSGGRAEKRFYPVTLRAVPSER